MLAEHAANADLRAVDTRRLTGLIRRRRRVRRAAAATVPVGLLLVIGAIWMVAPRADRPDVGGGERSAPPPPAPGGVVLGGCGAMVTGTVRTGAALTMSAAVPAQGLDRAGGNALIPVIVTNSGPAVRAVTATHPDITVVRNGVVVATPAGIRDAGTLVDLPVGQSHTFDTPIDLTDCADTGSAAAILGPGVYQFYAVQRFDVQPTGASPGYTVEVQGGPWSIELR
jgi:hypothetical protein